MKKILVSIISVFLLISCADDKKEPKKTSKSLSFTSKTIEKSFKDCSPEKGECTFISLHYPIAENGNGQTEKINKEIEHFLVNTVDYQDEGGIEKPEELVDNFLKNYEETAQEFPEYELPWEATINGNVIYKAPHIICIKFKTDMFTGGAHGYRSTNYLNFDPKTGKKIDAPNLFTSAFKDLVEKDFRRKKNIPANSNINSTGMFFENDEFHLPQNIGVSKDSIILHYNAYEIAPYAAGNFILVYPRVKIKEYLKVKMETPKS